MSDQFSDADIGYTYLPKPQWPVSLHSIVLALSLWPVAALHPKTGAKFGFESRPRSTASRSRVFATYAVLWRAVYFYIQICIDSVRGLNLLGEVPNDIVSNKRLLLTKREEQIARLVASGLGNRE